MNKIIVTGARGFIGRHTLPFLEKLGFEVHAITSKEIEAQSQNGKGPTWHKVNILDAKEVDVLCENVGASHLLHLAWYDNPRDRMTSERNIEWVEATLHLARKFSENGGKRFVMGGSCTEYDWKFGYCNESVTPTNPQSIYGECKLAVHKILEKYSTQIGLSYASGRTFFVYGPHEAESRLVAYAIRCLLMKQEAKMSHGNQMRDYLHVVDVADALVKLLVSDISGAVNIGSGRAVKLREIVDMAGEKLNALHLLAYGPVESIFDSPVVMADNSRLRNELEWVPKFDLEEGIEDTIKWWQKELEITAA